MLASGNVPIQFMQLPSGFRGTDETVRLMSKLSHGRYGARSPKIRALAINLLRSRGIPEKQYRAEMVALYEWVRDNIRYTRDVAGQETLSPPEEIAFNSQAGDCDDKSVLLAALLGAVGIATRYKTIGVTPTSYSHVYLQARPGPPGSPWISLDPIMRNKTAGWEAPASMVKVAKVYPENAPEDVNMSRNMNGLGYVADPRIVSHLSPDPVDEPPLAPYVVMDSMLDTDLPIEAISNNMPAFAQNAHYPDGRGPQPRLGRTRAHLQNNTIPPAELVARIQAEEAQGYETEQQINSPLDGFFGDFMGPEQLAAISNQPVVRERPRANMQVPALAQQPEGIDTMFGRRALVMRGDVGDRIIYRGLRALSEKPPIRPYEGMGGIQPSGALPGMGALSSRRMTGPGLADLADANAAASAGGVTAVSVVNGPMKAAGVALLLFGIYKLCKPKR